MTTDVGKAVAEFKGGRVEYRTDKVGNVHIRVGKASFTVEQLVANIRAVIDELQRAKPPSSKGRYFLSVTVSTTMSPGVRIDPAKARYTDEELAVTGLIHAARSERLRPPYYAFPHSSPPPGGRALNPIRQRPPVHPWVPKRPDGPA